MIFFAYTRSSPISIAKKSSNIFFPIEIGGPKFLSRGSPSQTLSQAFRCGAASARNFKLPLAFEGRLTWLRFFFSCAGRNCKKKCTSNNYSTRFFFPQMATNIPAEAGGSLLARGGTCSISNGYKMVSWVLHFFLEGKLKLQSSKPHVQP